MTKTYPAILRDGQIEWTGEVPPWTERTDPMPIAVVDQTPPSTEPEIPSEEEQARREAYVRSLVAEHMFQNRNEEI